MKKFKTLVRSGITVKQAERFQNALYNKYDHVRLVTAPTFSLTGTYIWEVG